MDENVIDGYINSEETITNNNIMPQNLEAEQSLLGSILFDNNTMEDLPANFNSDYFNVCCPSAQT